MIRLLTRILTFLRRRMPWVYWDFLHNKNLPRRFALLAYGTLADQLDDLTRIMSESTTLNKLQHFCNSIISRYEWETENKIKYLFDNIRDEF